VTYSIYTINVKLPDSPVIQRVKGPKIPKLPQLSANFTLITSAIPELGRGSKKIPKTVT